MKKIFIFMLTIIACLITTNVYAENLVMSYYGNPYYTISGNGEYHSSIVTFFEVDSEVAYCIEPGILVTDFSYHVESIDTLPYSKDQINLVSLIGYYGFEYPSHLNNNYRMATQALIWETLTGKTVNFYTEKNGNGNFIDLSSEKNEIMKLVNNHYMVPNISKDLFLSFNEDNIIVDSYNILDDFEIINNNSNLETYIENNKLHIKSNVVGDYQITLRKTKYKNQSTLLLVADNTISQKLMKLGINDNVDLKLNIHINGGKLFLNKMDSETKTNKSIGNSNLLNAKYGIYDENNNLIEELTTNILGEVVSNYLKFGHYYLKEIQSSYGYLIDNNKYDFLIDKNNLIVKLNVYENLEKKEVTILKTIEGDYNILNGEENITFEIYLTNNNLLYKTITTNKDGVAKIKLPFGSYLFHQVNTTEGYLMSDDFELTINEETEDIYKVIYDKKIKGSIEIIKSDIENGHLLKDAYIEVYKDNDLIYTGYTNEDGKLEFNDLPIGIYQVIEKKAPNGYILDDNLYFVEITSDIPDLLLEIKNKHEEVVVPNTSLNINSNLKYLSIGIMSIGLILIIINKKIFLR